MVCSPTPSPSPNANPPNSFPPQAYTSEPSYDPYIPRSTPATTPHAGSGYQDSRTAALQASIDDTVHVMQNNIQAASHRGAQLSDLEGKSDELAGSAGKFRRGAVQTRKRMWWKNKKMGCCLFVGIVILLVVIIVPSVVAAKRHHDHDGGNKDSSNGN
ncbi:Synaptobrevin [Ascosphaera apis ARSEF 7405]|uniref:Synaptobrevin n=1 Tax=Ascosphaera apis ARSEF 7405 TaxID=392613 RepID=A0A167VCK8_9EURO|nr:Synaptobrevin [Ascosphaera apis ARSEF 7405]